jgi:hypothetical protein
MGLRGVRITGPIIRLTNWLLSTEEKVSASIAAQLANGLFGSLPIFIGGVINSSAVAAIAAWRMQTAPFIGWVVFEIVLGLVRIGVVHLSHSASPARLERLRHVACPLSVAWAASVGIGAFLCLTSGADLHGHDLFRFVRAAPDAGVMDDHHRRAEAEQGS